MNRLAQASLLLAAMTGLALAWFMFEWLGNPWDHCDYPEECTSTWFPRAFAWVQYFYVASVLLAGVGMLSASAADWPRRAVALLAAAWIVVVVSVGITPMHGGGEAMTGQQIEKNGFLWSSSGYVVIAVIVAQASLVFGWLAVRTPSRATTRQGVPSSTG